VVIDRIVWTVEFGHPALDGPFNLRPDVATRKRTHSPDEPARQDAYRRLYLMMKRKLDAIEDSVTYLLGRIDKLQERMDKCNKSRNPN